MRHLITLINPIMRQITCTGRYVNVCRYRLLTRTVNISVNGAIVMWNIPVITERTELTNRPDIIFHGNKGKTCLLIDIAIPDGSNINTKKLTRKNKASTNTWRSCSAGCGK